MILLNGLKKRKVAFPFHLIENGIRKEQNCAKMTLLRKIFRALSHWERLKNISQGFIMQ